MLAPPPPILLDSASVDHPIDISTSPIDCSYYNRRGSSLSPRQMSELQQRQQRGRLRSASVFDEGSFFLQRNHPILIFVSTHVPFSNFGEYYF